MKATAAPAGPELQALRNFLLMVLASNMLRTSGWPGGRCSVLEQDLSQAGLGFCISAFVLLSSGLTERFTSCSLHCPQKCSVFPRSSGTEW